MPLYFFAQKWYDGLEEGLSMLSREATAKLYANGICQCMAAGKFRWIPFEGVKVYMCVKCVKPKYWPPGMQPY